MENKKREDGFYYVLDDYRWIIAEYDHSRWWLAGIEQPYNDDDFDEIDERRIERVEGGFLWQNNAKI